MRFDQHVGASVALNALFTVVVSVAFATQAGCFSPSVRECAISCNASTPCPSGASCLSDGFCHESASESLCTINGNIDASVLVDASGPCGNGVVEIALGEECDDFNGSSGDGCSATCAEEPGFVCVEQPSQCRPNPSTAGDLVITEILADPDGVNDDTHEWFEIFNPTSTDFDLRGMQGSDDGAETFEIAASLVIPAGAHMVLAKNADMGQNGGVDAAFGYGTQFLLGNGTDEIELRFGATVIDSVSWNNPPTGATRSLSGATYDAAGNDVNANYCDGVGVFGTNGDLGTPGAQNPACP